MDRFTKWSLFLQNRNGQGTTRVASWYVIRSKTFNPGYAELTVIGAGLTDKEIEEKVSSLVLAELKAESSS